MSSKVSVKQILLIPVKYPTQAGLTTTYGYPNSNNGKDAAISYAMNTEFKGPDGSMIKLSDAPDGMKWGAILDVAACQTRAGFKVFNGHLDAAEVSSAVAAGIHRNGAKSMRVDKDQSVNGAGLYVEDGAYSANLQQHQSTAEGTNEGFLKAMRGQFASANDESAGLYTFAASNADGVTEFHHIKISEGQAKAASVVSGLSPNDNLKGDTWIMTDGKLAIESKEANAGINIEASVVVQERKSTRSLESKIDALCSVNASLIELLKQKLL